MNKLLWLLLFPLLSFSQGEYNQWRFGYGAGLDFNGTSVNLVGSEISSAETAASVADCDGNLLFYTDGATIWNKNNVRMSNGSGLLGVGATYPTTQGAIIVRRPKSPFIYYLFTASDIYGINYNIINMASEGGLGRVIQKNIPLTSGFSQKLGVTYHADGESIWVITHYEGSNTYESFLVTSSGISTVTVKSSVGANFTSSHGDIKFNQQGTKVAAVVQDQNLISLADFNNITGQVSNAFAIVGSIASPHGCEFSPSGSKMYVTAWGSGGGVIQFNVLGDNASTLSSRTNLSGSFRPNGSLQLAPNGKIYVANASGFFGSGGTYLGVIDNPDATGVFAGWNERGINLSLNGSESSWELPNVTLVNNEVILPKEIIANNFCLGDITDFSLTNESAIVDVLWDFGDPSSGISNNSNSFRPTHQYSSPGIYTVEVTITNICEVEQYTLDVVINEGPVTNLDSTNVCPDLTTPIGLSPEAGVTYSWDPSIGLSNSNISNPDFDPAIITGQNITYFLSSVDSEGCLFLDTLEVAVFDKIDEQEDVFLCPGFGVTLSLGSSIIIANWTGTDISDPSSLTPYVDPSITTEYSVIQTDINNCLSYDTIIVEVTPEVPVDAGENQVICFNDSVFIGNNISPDSSTFAWDLAENVVDPFSAETFAFPASTQWLYLTVTNDTCSSYDSVLVTVNSLPNVAISPKDTTMCYDDTLNFTASGAITFEWLEEKVSIGVGSELEYVTDSSLNVFVSGVDANGCMNIDSSFITVLPLPIINLSNDTAICIGQSTTLVVSGGVSYLWYDNVLNGLSDNSITLLPDETKTYNVRVNSFNGCYQLDSIEVSINPLPTIGLTSDTLICKESNAFLWATGGTMYSWNPSDYLNDTTGSSVIAKPEDPITYEVIVVDENGCIDSAETSISLNDNPVAVFDLNYIPSCAGFEVQFEDNSQLADDYFWNFGDGTTSVEASPFHVFEFGTSLTTTLITVNNGICADTSSMDFEWKRISEFLDVFVQNVFTPNNDGQNDCFEIIIPDEFVGCTDYIMYNRWGMKVYDSKEFKTEFCGVNAYNQQDLPTGTYFYKLDIGDYKLNGFVQLTR